MEERKNGRNETQYMCEEQLTQWESVRLGYYLDVEGEGDPLDL